jgi:hypothetical protein
LSAYELEREPEAEQTLLRAVVKVSLETPTLFVAGLHDARPRSTELGQLCPELRLEAFVLQREPSRSSGRLEEAGTFEQNRIVQERGDRRLR